MKLMQKLAQILINMNRWMYTSLTRRQANAAATRQATYSPHKCTHPFYCHRINAFTDYEATLLVPCKSSLHIATM